MTPAQEVASILLKIEAVSIRPTEPYRYTSGILSPIYTDCRLLVSYPKERRRVIELMAERLKADGLKPDLLAGTSTAGIAPAAWLSDVLDLPMIYVRGQAKEHGKQSQIEGVLKPNQTAIIVEDLISTGKSSLETTQAIRDAKAKANDIMAIFSYTMPQSQAAFTKAGVNLHVLTTFADMVDQAAAGGMIKEDEKGKVMEWIEDTAGWGKKMGFE